MASRVQTLADLGVPQPVEPVHQPQRSLLSSHPDMLIPDTSLLQTISVQVPTGVHFVPTAEGQETRHRPTYSGHSDAARIVLGGVGGLVRGATSAYVQYVTTTQYLRGNLGSGRPSVVRVDHACPTRSQADDTTTSSNDAFIHDEAQDIGPVINTSGQQGTEGDSTLQHQHDTLADIAAEAQGHATAASQSETRAVVHDSEVPDRSPIAPNAQVPRGDIEVRFRHESFDVGSGGHEHARPLDGAAHDRDIGFRMLSPSRSSRFMRIGTAVSHHITGCEPLTDDLCVTQNDLLNGAHAETSEPIAWFDHQRLGGQQGVTLELRNPTTGMQREISFNVPGALSSMSMLYASIYIAPKQMLVS